MYSGTSSVGFKSYTCVFTNLVDYVYHLIPLFIVSGIFLAMTIGVLLSLVFFGRSVRLLKFFNRFGVNLIQHFNKGGCCLYFIPPSQK